MTERPFVVLVTGDRNWVDSWPIQRDLSTLYQYIELTRGHPKQNLVIIQGGQGVWKTVEDRLTGRFKMPVRGADAWAKYIGKRLGDDRSGVRVITYRANWEKYGRAAGPKRNQIMVDLPPHLVLAYHKDLKHSKGTKDCVQRALKAGIPVRVRVK